jgi:hypothetical protein
MGCPSRMSSWSKSNLAPHEKDKFIARRSTIGTAKQSDTPVPEKLDSPRSCMRNAGGCRREEIEPASRVGT